MKSLVITFDSSGTGRCLYSELINLASLGNLQVRRITNIEFDEVTQKWQVRNAQGKMLYSSDSRRECQEWEVRYFSRKLKRREVK